MVACIADLAAHDHWAPWRAIRCPTLVVAGERGTLDAAARRRMTDELPGARPVTIPDAGHDVHLDAPAAWLAALTTFLDEALPRARLVRR